MTDYLEDVRKIISKQLGILPEDIEEETSLEQDLSIGDLEMEDLLATLEEKYDIKISPETTSSFKKVSDIVLYLYENIDVTS